MNEAQTLFLENYLKQSNLEAKVKHQDILVDHFCADEENANLCAELILRGIKTATCSMKYWYESGLEVMPKVGDLQVVTDWYGNPTSVIEIIDVTQCRFSEVTAEFAELEGEGDKSLTWWRKAHWNFFSLECEEQGIHPSEDMLLVLEKFKVVFS